MSKLALTMLAAAAMAAPAFASICDVLAPELPSFCPCTDDGPIGATINCEIDFLYLDEIDFQVDFEPCAEPAHMSIAVSDSDFGIHYTIGGVTFGEDSDIPIPGLSLDIPFVGDAGIQAAVLMNGNIDSVELQVGVDACIDSEGEKECGSDILSELPVWLFSGTFSFGDVCNSFAAKQALAAGGSSSMPFAPVIVDRVTKRLRGAAPYTAGSNTTTSGVTVAH